MSLKSPRMWRNLAHFSELFSFSHTGGFLSMIGLYCFSFVCLFGLGFFEPFGLASMFQIIVLLHNPGVLELQRMNFVIFWMSC